MKVLLVALAAAVVAWGCTSTKGPETTQGDTAPTVEGKPASDTLKIIEHIKDVYAAINKERLVQKSFEWEADTACEAPPMGGTLTYFYRDKELVKILNAGGEDHGSWREEYYFESNHLVFIYQNNTHGGAANPDEMHYQNRYYFSGNELVKKIESNPAMQLDVNAIQDLSKTIYRLKDAKSSTAIARIFSCNPA